jgi:hypothetical protein
MTRHHQARRLARATAASLLVGAGVALPVSSASAVGESGLAPACADAQFMVSDSDNPTADIHNTMYQFCIKGIPPGQAVRTFPG